MRRLAPSRPIDRDSTRALASPPVPAYATTCGSHGSYCHCHRGRDFADRSGGARRARIRTGGQASTSGSSTRWACSAPAIIGAITTPGPNGKVNAGLIKQARSLSATPGLPADAAKMWNKVMDFVGEPGAKSLVAEQKAAADKRLAPTIGVQKYAKKNAESEPVIPSGPTARRSRSSCIRPSASAAWAPPTASPPRSAVHS